MWWEWDEPLWRGEGWPSAHRLFAVLLRRRAPALALKPQRASCSSFAGALPRQYYYDRLARTAFWTSLFAFLVMVLHLALLGR